jgi:hypothetical protein
MRGVVLDGVEYVFRDVIYIVSWYFNTQCCGANSMIPDSVVLLKSYYICPFIRPLLRFQFCDNSLATFSA